MLAVLLLTPSSVDLGVLCMGRFPIHAYMNEHIPIYVLHMYVCIFLNYLYRGVCVISFIQSNFYTQVAIKNKDT